MNDKLNSWKKSAVATAAVLGLLSGHAYALTLGRITVQSSLGEPLQAQIEVIDMTAEEAASLKAAIASPDAFSAAGLQYNPAMPDLQVKLQKQADGRAVIELSSQRLINDPFIDLLIEATWASGRIIRDYTLLLDPPILQKANTLPPTQAQVPEAVRQPSAPLEKAGPSSTPPPPATQQVKAGDTASAIALRNKSANVSLDQMLVALLRANPNAFVGNNVNRLKTGALIAMPTAAMAGLETKTEASQILVAQSLDFNDYRRKLAAASPKSPILSADRRASGTLQAKVEDKKLLTPTSDKLTLSKGAIKDASAEATMATALAAKDSAERAAEIAKNISDLSKLGVTSNKAAPPPQPPPSAPASAPAAAATPVIAVAQAPHASAAVSAPVAAAASAPKSVTHGVDGLINNPYIPAGALGLMAALIGFGIFRYKKRNPSPSSLLGDTSELTPLPETAEPQPSFSDAVSAARDKDLDLNLDLGLDTTPDAVSAPAPKRPELASLNEAVDLALPDLDIFSPPVPPTTTPTPAFATPPIAQAAAVKPRVPLASSAPIAASTPDLDALDFDLGALSLDLDEPLATEPPEIIGDGQDPFETKLALAHEFRAIGDEHGARALIEEVIAEASGAMKTKAERALSQRQVS